MRIGIAVHYRRSPAAYTALSLAALFHQQLGCHVTIYDRNHGRHGTLDPYWDNRLVHNGKDNWAAWAKDNDALLVMGERLAAARLTAPLLIYHLHGSCTLQDVACYSSAAAVVVPFGGMRKALVQHLQLSNTITIPWHSGSRLLPARRPWPAEPCVLQLPSKVNYWRLSTAACNCPQCAEGTYNALARQPDNCATPNALLLTMALSHYDLVTWPAMHSTYDLLYYALAAGVPVLASRTPWLQEHFCDDLLVECPLQDDWCGLPLAVQDGPTFQDGIATVLRWPATAREAAEDSRRVMMVRNSATEKRWLGLFEALPSGELSVDWQGG